MKYNYKIYLASNSQRRIDFLKMLGLKFENFSVDIDESQKKDEKAQSYIKRIISLKKEAALEKTENGVIIVADTIVVLDNIILQKPKNEKEARNFLNLLSNKKHDVLTAFSLASKDKKIDEFKIVNSEVYFKKLSENEINFYISSKEYEGKAGAYAIQGVGAFMVDKINGSYSNIVGLPVKEFFELLNKKKIIEL